MARRLVELDDTRGYRDLGFASLAAYALQRFAWDYGKVRDMKTLVQRLGHQPQVAQAFFAGELPWSKAVRISRMISAVPEQEGHWLARAQQLSTKQLDHEIAEAKGEPRRARLVIELEAPELALFDEACRALQAEGLQLTRSEAVVELARRALHGGRVGPSAFRVLLTHDPDTDRTTQRTPAGTIELPEPLAERILCEAEVQDREGRVKRTIPARVLRNLARRSGGVCEVPGCTNRAHLEAHHNRGWRSGHHLDHLFHLCSGHHDAVHEGALRIVGSWSEGVSFLLADGTLLGTAGGAGAGGGGEGVSRETPEGVSPEAPEAVSRETPEAGSPETPEAVSRETPEAGSPEIPAAGSPETPEAVSPEAPEAVSPEAPEAVSRETPEAVSRENPPPALRSDQEPEAIEAAEEASKSVA
ncbi:MAG: hypothetical protein AB7N76_00200 [Planctomycetota bacterium]